MRHVNLKRPSRALLVGTLGAVAALGGVAGEATASATIPTQAATNDAQTVALDGTATDPAQLELVCRKLSAGTLAASGAQLDATQVATLTGS